VNTHRFLRKALRTCAREENKWQCHMQIAPQSRERRGQGHGGGGLLQISFIFSAARLCEPPSNLHDLLSASYSLYTGGPRKGGGQAESKGRKVACGLRGSRWGSGCRVPAQKARSTGICRACALGRARRGKIRRAETMTEGWAAQSPHRHKGISGSSGGIRRAASSSRRASRAAAADAEQHKRRGGSKAMRGCAHQLQRSTAPG